MGTGFSRNAAFGASAIVLVAAAALAGSRGAPISEAGLLGRRDILFFCDFEGTNWARYFSPGTRRAYSRKTTLTNETDPRLVFAGRHSARSLHKRGEHGAGAVTCYLKEGLDEAFMRAYFRLADDFSLAPANAMKILWFFGYRPGNEYPSPAGVRPTGADKFSCHIVVNRNMRLGFYCYHMDQRGGYGDGPLLDVKGGASLKPGEWYCLEIGVRVNDVGEKNGWLKAWVNGELKGHMKDLRFRTVDDLKIRRASVTLYTGGAGQINTSPKDQYSYYDNYVIAEKYIGPAVFRRPAPKRRSVKKIEMPKRKKPRREALAAWDAKLRARLGEERAAGRRVRFSVTAFQERFELVSVDEVGQMKLSGGGTDVDMEWSRLEISDRLNLARAVLRDESPADHCLVAFYLIAAGDEEGAREHLDEGGPGALAVEAAFEMVGGGAVAGRSAGPAEHREPKERVARAPRPAEKEPSRPKTDKTGRAAAKLFLEAETAFIDGDAGEAGEAKELFERILRRHPDSPFASRAKEYLEMLK